jgi:hypothetical protein
MTDDEQANDPVRLGKLAEILKMMASDDAVKLMAAGVCRERQMPNLGHLAQYHPEVFDEFYEAAKDFVDQAPDDEMKGVMW